MSQIGKYCSRCDTTKPLADFNKKGQERFQPYCRLCQREWHAKYYKSNPEPFKARSIRGAERRRAAFEVYKATLSCNRCPENDVACLDFHHMDSSQKEVNIAMVAHAWTLERLKKEIAKCEVLCSNCHRKHHYYTDKVWCEEVQ